MSILDDHLTSGTDIRPDHRHSAEAAVPRLTPRRVICLRRRGHEESADVQALLIAYMEAVPGLCIGEAPPLGSAADRALKGAPNSVRTDGTWLWLNADIAVMREYDWWPEEPDFVRHVLLRVAATF